MQLPFLRMLVITAFLFSYCNDNHLVKAVAPPHGTQSSRRPSKVEDDFTAWAGGLPQGQPWFFVVTEGGGIRAAYWTADVLAQLQDTFGDFDQRLYGISSVSGGSLGAAVYESLLARQLRSGQFRAGSTSILKVDSLAPVLAMGLYPDMLQHVLWWPCNGLDRGRALEESWSAAFESGLSEPNVFSAPFDALWSGDAASRRLPRMFLNTTWVETGRRAIISYPDVTDAVTDSIDVEETLGCFSLAQSVHLSARFTYVSPAGLLTNNHGIWGHLVDGGYFDNSGAATALDVIGAIVRTHPGAQPPLIIAIRYLDAGSRAEPNANLPPAARWATEVVSPVDAVLNARVARGTQALAALERAYATIEFHLTAPEGESLPLGWMLSARTRGEIDAALASADNQCALARVAKALGFGAAAALEPCPK